MKCPLCPTELYSSAGDLVSCEGTPSLARHKFYVKWNSEVNAGEDADRILELAVSSGATEAGAT